MEKKQNKDREGQGGQYRPGEGPGPERREPDRPGQGNPDDPTRPRKIDDPDRPGQGRPDDDRQEDQDVQR